MPDTTTQAVIDISVVIPAYGPTPHLAELIEAVLNGTVLPREIIVSHSGSDDPAGWLQERFPEVIALHSDARLFAGAARNRGAAMAQGEVLAFCDSDVIPHHDWLEQLSLELKDHPQRFVIGSVGMARTGGYWGISNWLCEFSEMAPWRKSGPQVGGASCNMAVWRKQFEQVGGFDETMTPGEDTLLFLALRGIGLEQWFSPNAIVGHYNHSGFRAFANHQFRLGIHFAKVRSTTNLPGNAVIRYPVLAIGIWLPKFVLVARRMMEDGAAGLSRLMIHGPALLIGAICHAAGVFRGSIAARASRPLPKPHE